MATGVTATAFARLHGVAKSAVTKWSQHGLLVRYPDGSIDIERSNALLAQRPRRYRGGKARDAGGKPESESNGNGAADTSLELGDISIEQIARATGWSLAEAQRVKETFLALLRVQEYQTKAGELLPRDKNRLFVMDLFLRVRTRMLAMPAGLAAPLHALKTVAEIRARLDDAVNDILAELSAPDLIGPIDWARAQAVLDQAGG
jgi:hypothetical protein